MNALRNVPSEHMQPAAAALDGAHAQQGHAVDVDAARVDDVGDVRVEAEHAALARGARPCAPR